MVLEELRKLAVYASVVSGTPFFAGQKKTVVGKGVREIRLCSRLCVWFVKK